MKKSIPIMSVLVVALNIMVLSFTSTAQQNVIDDGSGAFLNCKWAQMTCESGQEREICVTDGDGNTCSCGTVTRPC